MSDNLQSNVLTVNPDGTIGADFTGTVNALGLVLPAATSTTGTAENKIEWQRQDGAVVAEAFAYQPAPDQPLALFIQADQPDPLASDTTQISLVAAGELNAGLNLFSGSAAGHGDNRVAVQVGNTQPIVLDDLGRSNFLQLLSAQKLRLGYGTVGISWPGGSRQTNTVNVNHGLAGTPAIAAAFSTNANAAYAVVGTSTTQISVQGNTLDASAPGAGTSLNVFWIAIG